MNDRALGRAEKILKPYRERKCSSQKNQSFAIYCFRAHVSKSVTYANPSSEAIKVCSNVLCLLKDMVLLHFHQIQDSDLLHRMCSQSVPCLLIINFKIIQEDTVSCHLKSIFSNLGKPSY